MPPLGNPSAISYSMSSARSDLKTFTFPLAPYNFRMRAICDESDMRTLLRLMLMAHSRATHSGPRDGCGTGCRGSWWELRVSYLAHPASDLRDNIAILIEVEHHVPQHHVGVVDGLGNFQRLFVLERASGFDVLGPWLVIEVEHVSLSFAQTNSLHGKQLFL